MAYVERQPCSYIASAVQSSTGPRVIVEVSNLPPGRTEAHTASDMDALKFLSEKLKSEMSFLEAAINQAQIKIERLESRDFESSLIQAA